MPSTGAYRVCVSNLDALALSIKNNPNAFALNVCPTPLYILYLYICIIIIYLALIEVLIWNAIKLINVYNGYSRSRITKLTFRLHHTVKVLLVAGRL